MLAHSNILLTDLPLLLFFVNEDINEREDCLWQQREAHDPPAPLGANIAPVLWDIQVAPYEDGVCENAADVACDPV